MYRPSKGTYELVAAGALLLTPLFRKTSATTLKGELRYRIFRSGPGNKTAHRLVDTTSGRPLATLEFEAQVAPELRKSLAAFKV